MKLPFIPAPDAPSGRSQGAWLTSSRPNVTGFLILSTLLGVLRRPALVEAQSSGLHIKDVVRGVPLSKLSLYKPGAAFECFDASRTITFDKVNDDYCDCPDGSDEPGTSACPNAYFHCHNIGHSPADIYSSRVNDGICDCCDGSDEHSGVVVCEDTCQELGKVAKLEKEARLRSMEAGKDVRLKYVEEAAQTLSEKRARLAELEEEVKVAKEEKERLEAAKNTAEAPEKEAKDEHQKAWDARKATLVAEKDQQKASKVFKELDINQDGLVSVEEMQAHIEFDVDQNGEVSLEEAQEYMEDKATLQEEDFVRLVWPNVKGIYKPLMPPGVDTNIGTTETPPSTTQSPTDEQHDQDDEEDLEFLPKDDSDDVDDNVDDTETDAGDVPSSEPTSSPASGDRGDGDGKDEEQEEQMPPYDDATQKLIDEANDARKLFDDADKKARDLESELADLRTVNEVDFGPQSEFYPLKGQCFEYDSKEYTYKLCPFDTIYQDSKGGGGSTRLGGWGKWTGTEAGGGVKYSSMLYERGENCWNGPDRSGKVEVLCGAENKLTSASEPSRCEYAFTFETPALCSDEVISKVAGQSGQPGLHGAHIEL